MPVQPDYARMSPEEYEASAGEGRRWVYHASERADAFKEGVLMANVPQHLARQRFASGTPVEFAPGAGLGQGVYVSGSAQGAEGYGHFMHAFAVPTEHLQVPPELARGGEGYRPDDVEYHLDPKRGSGGEALLTHDVERAHVVDMGKITVNGYSGHDLHQLQALRRGEHVPEEHMSDRLKDRVKRSKENGWEL